MMSAFGDNGNSAPLSSFVSLSKFTGDLVRRNFDFRYDTLKSVLPHTEVGNFSQTKGPPCIPKRLS